MSVILKIIFKKMEDLNKVIGLAMLSVVPIILFYIILMSVTFLFVEEINYTLGFWVYPIVSSILGLVLTACIVKS